MKAAALAVLGEGDVIIVDGGGSGGTVLRVRARSPCVVIYRYVYYDEVVTWKLER